MHANELKKIENHLKLIDENTISPIYEDANQKIGYTSVRQNITSLCMKMQEKIFCPNF